jgi:hypothetical protein
MRSARYPTRLLAVGLVFVVLGATQWIWFEPEEFGQGAVTGGVAVAIVAIGLIARGRSTHHSSSDID